jgi:hypothetical protein
MLPRRLVTTFHRTGKATQARELRAPVKKTYNLLLPSYEHTDLHPTAYLGDTLAHPESISFVGLSFVAQQQRDYLPKNSFTFASGQNF